MYRALAPRISQNCFSAFPARRSASSCTSARISSRSNVCGLRSFTITRPPEITVSTSLPQAAYEDAEAQDLRIRERSERALREHIEGVRHAEDTLTALLGGHEALAYLAALRDGQILQENECEHYAAQIAEAGAAWETVLEGVSFEDLSRLRHLLREVDEYTKGGGELFNGFQHETERIPAHRLEELHQLGTALLGECPENDCTIYRNVFRMAVDVDGQMGKLTGHARETMQREHERLLRELNRLYTMNHAVKKYREAQHDRT